MRRFSAGLVPCAILVAASVARGQSAFPQGVASGDVTAGSALCWTRTDRAATLRLDLFTPPSPTTQRSVDAAADATNDFTVKFDLSDLAAATAYEYRFTRLDDCAQSATGAFRTAPASDAATSFRFVYSGDSNAARQPFQLLGFAAAEQPDLWFYAGDTIYGDFPAGPLGVATTLDEYRAKYRQNRDDAFLRALFADAPVVCQWDDHEVANDYDGGEPEPGLSAERIAAGQRAFFEYMPIRSQNVAGDERRTYRSVRYGALAEFFILDCRQYRSADAGRGGGAFDPYGYFLPTREPATIAMLSDPARTLLGAAQLAWLKQGLSNSTATWKFVCSSMPFTSLLLGPYDRWDGYEAERYDLLRYIDTEGIANVVLLSADIHGNLFNPNVANYSQFWLGRQFSPGFRLPELIAGPIGMATFRQEVEEFFVPLIGLSEGSGLGTLATDVALGAAAARVVIANGLSFVELNRYGYLVVDVSADRLVATHRGIVADSAASDPTLETLHTTTLAASGAPVCGVFPNGALLATATLAGRSRRHGRREQHKP